MENVFTFIESIIALLTQGTGFYFNLAWFIVAVVIIVLFMKTFT